MRTNIVHIGASELTYEIRQIVEIANRVSVLSGKPIFWENIGDPVQKGEKIPDWIKEIIASAVRQDISYAYSPTRGLLATREFLVNKVNALGGAQIDPDDIVFFNGLGDAVNKVYGLLRREARVIGPSPSYPTHSSSEAAHAGYAPITYRLLPEKGWMPDMEELRNKVRYNDSIAGIMIINPDNPTGAVFPDHIVREMIDIAREYDLFILADEIYMNMVFSKEKHSSIAELIGDVPAISLKGISKEFPWPGGRCGWMEVYNQKKSPVFQKYVKSILDAKMLEVCSTTLPQMVIPQIMGHSEYPNWQKKRNEFFEKRSRMVAEIFSKCRGVVVNPPSGAFYLSVVFDQPLKPAMQLKMENPEVAAYIDSLCPPGVETDKKFVYHLLGSKQVCVVPLTSFVCRLPGFRTTLLEQDDDKFRHIYTTIAGAVEEFLASA